MLQKRMLFLATLFVAIAVPAAAQTFTPRQPRPDWGIFGSGVSNTEQRLVLTATFGGGYEDDLSKASVNPAAPEGPAAPAAPTLYSGAFGSAGASLRYIVDKKSINGGLGFSAYGRNYKDMTDPFVGTYSADGNLNFTFSDKSSLATNYWAGQYLQNLAPRGYNETSGGWGAPGMPQVPGNPGPFTTGDTYRGLGAYANYSQKFTTNLSAFGGYSYYANGSWTSSTTSNYYDSQWVNAGMRYALGKGLGLRAGYGTTFGGFTSSSQNFRNRTIDAGVDYGKSLSLTRRSSLSFSTGVSGIVDQLNKTHYYFVGGANFTYEIGRSWNLYASINRNANFYQTLGQPTVDDWASAGLGGLIGRRVDVQGGVSAWRGSAIGTNAKVYDSASAFAGARVAINRVLAVSANYSYYRYGFTNDVLVVPPGFVRQTDRQTVQVSLVVWAPLFTKARSANAPR